MSSRSRLNKGSNAGAGDSDANSGANIGATDGAIGSATSGGLNVGVKVVVTNETVEPESSFPGQSCRVCREEDNDEMVRCDKCLKWFHFTCVGVTQAIEDVPWSCADCENSTQNTDEPLNPAGTGASYGGTKKKTAMRANYPSTHLQPSQIKPKKPSKEKHHQNGNNKLPQKKVEPSPNIPIQVVGEHSQQHSNKCPSNIIEPLTRKGNPASSRVSSRVSNRSAQSLAKLKLQKLEDERVLNEKKLEQERLYLEEKYRLLEQMASDGGSDANSQSDASSWLPRAESSHRSQLGPQRSTIRETVHLPANLPANHRPRTYEEAHRSVDRGVSQPVVSRACDEVYRSDFHEVPQHASRLPERDEDRCPLTNKQLAARQAISKDLPPFSGNPEDWPLFIATFNNTTAMCGFSNDENIYRLQRSLKGRAFEVVKSRLVHPANVPGVLKTLKMMFGQPEAIVHSLIEKIHALPAIREDRLETLVDFAVSVENFCATVDACGLEEYLYNTTLLHQLVSKLPPTIKLNWAQYRITLPGANLAAFSTWMYSLAEAASTVTIPNIANSRPDSLGTRVVQ